MPHCSKCLRAGHASEHAPQAGHQAPGPPSHTQARKPVQPAQTANHLNGHASSPGYQPPKPVSQQVPAQQQGPAVQQQPAGHDMPPQPHFHQQPRPVPRQQPPVTRQQPTSRQAPQKVYNPQVPVQTGAAPPQHTPETDWEAPPEPHHRQPARKLYSPQVPAHTISNQQQRTPDLDWEVPPEPHYRQPLKQKSSPQAPRHPPGFSTPAKGVPPGRPNGHPVNIPAMQQPNGTSQQGGYTAERPQSVPGATLTILLHVSMTPLAQAAGTVQGSCSTRSLSVAKICLSNICMP